MISIIISSVNKANLQQVSENISATIGVPFEIVATDNSKGQMGICEVYNKAMLGAQYDILCFIHEDVLIKTNNWGQKLLALFEQDPKLGLIGVAGSSYKPLTPSGVGGYGVNTHYHNFIQSYKYKKNKTRHVYSNPDKQSLAEVVCIDGVFMATTRQVAEEFMFDEITLKGFHGYDIDFSLSVSQKYKVAVTFDILLNHFSEGLYNDVWMEENLKLHNKWNRHLPLNVGKLTHEQVFVIEKNTFKYFIDELIKFNYPISTAIKMLWKNKRFFQLDSTLFFKLKFYIFKKYIKSKPSLASYIW
ncbi:glycosyltransferase [Mucilaginibacter sp. KACC 22773]|uniref:glycosyltransferase n=1 Tax=Mucilaginibacter sp. KACC 22773 TaxID=3025671 RepID=UPI0023673F59|nr:glycosyltransferase [Mucilaginibacter sp. KACC 22773]WDF78710.1 glycosyltransferase [Mucilaginibacter sp. KACC 22773]